MKQIIYNVLCSSKILCCSLERLHICYILLTNTALVPSKVHYSRHSINVCVALNKWVTPLPLLEAFSLSEISESSFSASFNFATYNTKLTGLAYILYLSKYGSFPLLLPLIFIIVTSFKRINSEVHLNLLMELTFFIYLILTELIPELKNQELNRRNVQNTDFILLKRTQSICFHWWIKKLDIE